MFMISLNLVHVYDGDCILTQNRIHLGSKNTYKSVRNWYVMSLNLIHVCVGDCVFIHKTGIQLSSKNTYTSVRNWYVISQSSPCT